MAERQLQYKDAEFTQTEIIRNSVNKKKSISGKAKIARFFMNLMPNEPVYQEEFFVQELFRHPKYNSLDNRGKKEYHQRIVKLNVEKAKKKPFDLFYPKLDLKKIFVGKNLLDMGCSVGGDTFVMGENWKPKTLTGLDFSADSIVAARDYNEVHESDVGYSFYSGYAEKMPFENDFFDAIVSHDTVEHVRSVKETLSECKRVLKKDGAAYIVFPSFKLPFGGAHVDSVTRTPFLEWFFSPKTINEAYQDIISKWGPEHDWFKPAAETDGDWAVVKGGIGVNGTTYAEFRKIANEVGFSDIEFVKIPLLYVSNTANKYPFVKFFSTLLKPFMFINGSKDYLTQRFAFVLTK